MSAPPGFHTVPTTGDGNCLFHSIFYAWFPEEGVDVANRSESANLIRKIIADNALATIKNDRIFTLLELEDAFRLSRRSLNEEQTELYTRLYSELSEINQELAEIEPSLRAQSGVNANMREGLIARQSVLYENMARIYKEAVLLTSFFWGGEFEIGVANDYAMKNSLPEIRVWNEETSTWYSGGAPVGEPCRDWAPIANSGNIHFLICVKDEGLNPNAPEVSANNSNLASSSNGSEITFLDTVVSAIKSGFTLNDFKSLDLDLEKLREIGVSEEYLNKVIENSAAEEKKKKGTEETSTLPFGINRAAYNSLKAAGVSDEDMWQYMGGERSKRVTKKRKVSKKKHTRKY
jgi:hypothetical protein